MKIFAKTLCLALLAMVCTPVLAQEKDASTENKSKHQLMYLHIDDVKPSMTDKYEETTRKLSTMLAEHNISDVQYKTFRNDENQFLFGAPIKSMGELDKNLFATLEAKAGKDAVKNLMDEFNGCLNSHTTQVIAYLPQQSYRPEIKEGENYRVWDFWYFNPADADKAKDILNEWITLYEKREIASGFRSYTPVLGIDGPGYAIVSWAKGPAEHAQQAEEIRNKLGQEGKDLMDRTMKITTKMNSNTGYYLPELSYEPPVPVATGNK